MTKLSIGDIPRLTVRVDWKDLDPKLEGGHLDVWVNPDGDFWALYLNFNVKAEEFDRQRKVFQTLPEESEKAKAQAQKVVDLGMEKIQLMHEVYSSLWDLPVEEVRAFATEPLMSGVYRWCTDTTWEMIDGFRTNRKKV